MSGIVFHRPRAPSPRCSRSRRRARRRLPAATRRARRPAVDQNGARFTLRELRRPVAVIFVASRCGDACPLAEGIFARLAAELAASHLDAGLVTITLDPAFDRPFVMASKARAFRADAARWRWASGDPADVTRAARRVQRAAARRHVPRRVRVRARRARPFRRGSCRSRRAPTVTCSGLLRAARALVSAAQRWSRRSIASARERGIRASCAHRSNATRASSRRPPRMSTVPSANRARA